MNVIIAGGGKVGSHLAALLTKDGHGVKVVEYRSEQITHLQSFLSPDRIIAGSFTDPKTLELGGIRTADVVVALTPSDEDNLVVATLAKFEYRVKRVIARANDPDNAWMFTPEMGVDVPLTEADLMAHVVAEEMSLGDMMTLLKLNKGKFSLVQEKVHPASGTVGRSLSELELAQKGCVITAIIRDRAVVVPQGSTVLKESDELIALVPADKAEAFAQLLAKKS